MNKVTKYKDILNKIHVELSYELERQFLEYQKDKNHAFVLNGINLDPLEFLGFLGEFVFSQVPSMCVGFFVKGISEYKILEDVLKNDIFIRKFPGVNLPPKPEWLEEWEKSEKRKEFLLARNQYLSR